MTYDESRERTLFLLYNVLFTEVSVFLYEEVTLILVYVYNMTDEEIEVDTFDKFNIWLAVLSAIATFFLLLVTIVYSLNVRWCRDMSKKLQAHDNAREKLMAGGRFGGGLLKRVLQAGLFLLFFAVILSYISFVLQASILLVTKDDVPKMLQRRVQLLFSGPTAIFLFGVLSAWLVASYFSCKLRQQARAPIEFDDIFEELQRRQQQRGELGPTDNNDNRDDFSDEPSTSNDLSDAHLPLQEAVVVAVIDDEVL